MIMFHLISAAFLVMVATVSGDMSRRLSYQRIAGYEPGSDVTSHNALDLDQKMLEHHLGQTPPDFANAKLVYSVGGHSGALATMLTSAVPTKFNKSAVVVQAGSSCVGDSCTLKYEVAAGATSVTVYYGSDVACIEGAHNTDSSIAGCCSTSAALSIAGVSVGNPSAVANSYRTLQGFSLQAEAKMKGQTHYEKFKTYYGSGDYGNKYIMAALDGTGAFAGKASVVRVEAAKKGSAYMNVWMYTVREMEDAIEDCKADCINCNDKPVHAWDEAVAFYTGSLVGTDASAGSGKMLYALAEKRCKNYKTCASIVVEKQTASGKSAVNTKILSQFQLGQAALQGSRCKDVPAIKEAIVKLMVVPLVQGALRYAYKVDRLQGGDKEKAEGAVFAASVLPMIAHCDAAAAKIISNNLAIESATPMNLGFTAVKEAFEKTYACLGITCADVGGLLVTSTPPAYHADFSPCGTGAGSHADHDHASQALGTGIGAEVLLASLFLHAIVQTI
jgi:hypothetical protein